MADNIGSLKVLLGLDAAEYTRGLSKAERDAQRFARNLREEIATAAKVLAGLGVAAAAIAIENARAIISEAAALNDLSDATGSSVEALSRLNNQAKIAGADFGTLQSAVLRLSAGMAGADDESSKVKEALKILGISAKDPVEALQQVAVKLNTYADGVNKVGLAQALFGKQGLTFLATLKDIAELQDVGATVTKRQAEEAENLEKAFRRLSVEATGFKNAVLSDVVPAITRMIAEFTEGIRIAGSFGQALLLFGTLNPFDKPREGIRKLEAELVELEKSRPKDLGRFGAGEAAEFDAAISQKRKQIEFLRAQERRIGESLIDPANADRIDRLLGKKPQAPNPPSKDAGKAARDQATETERLIESLKRQVIAQQDLNEVDTIELEIAKLQKDAKSGLTAAGEEQIRILARQIDAGREAKRAADEQRKAEEDARRERERAFENAARQTEAAQRELESVEQGNEALREQIIALRDGEDALLAYNKAKNEKIAAELEDRTATAAAAGALTDEAITALKKQAQAIRDRNKLLDEVDFARRLAEDARELKQQQEQLLDITGSAIADFVTGTKSAHDTIKALIKDIDRFLVELALKNLKNQILGNTTGTGSSGIFGWLAQLVTSAFTGGGGVPGIGGFSGGGFGEHFAAGTSWAPGGMALVGEGGPEVVNLPAGSRVTPATQWRGGGGTVVINQYIPRNANTQAHRQAALDAFSIAAEAQRRR